MSINLFDYFQSDRQCPAAGLYAVCITAYILPCYTAAAAYIDRQILDKHQLWPVTGRERERERERERGAIIRAILIEW